jgi:hypothetical protein
MKQTRIAAKFARGDSGAVIIEFVATLPIFLAALAMSFEFGRVLIAHHGVVNNARSAARYLARTDGGVAAQANAKNIVRTGKLSGGAAPDWLPASAVVVKTDYAPFSSADFRESGNVARVYVRANFPLSIFGFLSEGAGPTLPFVVVEDARLVGE